MTTFKSTLNNITKNPDYHLEVYSKFNFFRVMYHMKEEERLHSRFLAFLLDPDGSHEQGSKFLELFLKEINIEGFDLRDVCVRPNEYNKSEYQLIDIYLTNKINQTIIIENKIFAGDSNKKPEEEINPLRKYQLPRYYQIATKEGKEVMKLIYLALDKREPEGYYNDDYPKEVKALLQKACYRQNILNWLKACLDACIHSEVKYVIQQYQYATTIFFK